MALLIRKGWTALGLLVLAGTAPAQTAKPPAPVKIETAPQSESRVRFPFFRFFSSSSQPAAPAAPAVTTMAQTAEPPLADPVQASPTQAPPPPVTTTAQVIATPNRSGPALAAPAPRPQTPAVTPAPTPPAPPRAANPIQNHADFASQFQALPGQYHVVMLHPFTGQPVNVDFQLPPTKGAYKTRVTTRYVEFDSPDHTVDIRFSRDGRVFVDQD